MDGQHCRLMLMMMVVVGMTVVVPTPVQQLKQNNEIDNVKTTMPHDRSYATPTSNTPSDEGYLVYLFVLFGFSDDMEEMSVTSSKRQFLTSISFIQRNDGFWIFHPHTHGSVLCSLFVSLMLLLWLLLVVIAILHTNGVLIYCLHGENVSCRK